MQYLARKIQRAKWYVLPFMTTVEISADAITGHSLRTTGNELSLWECDTVDDDLREVVLALAANMQHLETVDIVLLRRSELDALEFQMEPREGNTPVQSLRHRHINAVKLTASKIYQLAEKIALNVRENLLCYRFIMSDVRNILIEGIKSGRLDLDDLHGNVKEKIRGFL